MGIILKHTLKNIFGKPGRTLLVLFCFILCSFIAIFSFDISNTINSTVTGFMSQMLGTTDVMAEADEEIDFSDPKYPANTTINVKTFTNTKYIHDEETYYIANESNINIFSMDLELAAKMKFMTTSTTSFGDEECLVSESYLEAYDVEVGDSITLTDVDKNELTFKIVGTTSDMSKLFPGHAVAITDNAMTKLNPKQSAFMYLVDFEDNSVALDVYKQLQKEYPRGYMQCVTSSEAIEEQLGNITKVFMIVLLICILMVIFVTISVSDRVICERMSVIGTFRSLGFSRNVTTAILLAENAIYGLIGSLIGIGFYSLVRIPIVSSLFNFSDSVGDMNLDVDYGSISPVTVLMVVLAAIFIGCMCSIKEIVKAVKTPIRDIIFANKDTEYKNNKATTIIGISCLAIGILMLFFKEVFACQIIAIIAIEISISILSPYFFIFVGKGLARVFEKNEKIVPSLAAKESYTKKNTIGASALIATVVSLCIIVMVYSSSNKYEYENPDLYKADVTVDGGINGEEMISLQYIENLPGVTDVEYVYDATDSLEINGELCDLGDVIPVKEGGFKYYYIGTDIPTNISEDEVYVTRSLLKKYNLKVGETYDFTFKKGNPLEFRRSLKVAGIVNYYLPTLFVNYDFFDEIYNTDLVTKVCIKTDNPDETANTIRRYSSLTKEAVLTSEETQLKDQEDAKNMVVIINVILVIGCGVTFIGAAGNLLLGFEGRKRECAVLLSTSLSRKRLSLMFLLESFFASFSAILLAIPFGFALLIPIKNLFESLNQSITIHFEFGTMAITLILMLVAFTLTSIQPIRNLNKMKIAEQLKYE